MVHLISFRQTARALEDQRRALTLTRPRLCALEMPSRSINSTWFLCAVMAFVNQCVIFVHEVEDLHANQIHTAPERSSVPSSVMRWTKKVRKWVGRTRNTERKASDDRRRENTRAQKGYLLARLYALLKGRNGTRSTCNDHGFVTPSSASSDTSGGH